MRRLTVAVVVGLALGTAGCSSSADSPPPAGGATPSAGAAAPGAVRNARYSWTITKTETVPTITDKDGTVRKPPGDAVAFFRITMTVKNLTSGAQPYSVYDDHLTDAAGLPWAASGFETSGGYDAVLPDFAPGEQRALVELFPIGAGMKPAAAVLGAFDNNDGNGAKAPLA